MKNFDENNCAKLIDEHVSIIKEYLKWCAESLYSRGAMHDYSKRTNLRLYLDSLNGDNEEQWNDVHSKSERHHLHNSIPKNVNLFDVIEHICDRVSCMEQGEVFENVDILDGNLLRRAYANTLKMIQKDFCYRKE